MSTENKEQPAQATPSKKAHKVPMNAREELNEFFRTAVIAVVLALLIRSFFYEPFNIPSGSMKPTLEVGDYLFVDKPAYGYSRFSFPFGLAPIKGRVWEKEPVRGDVVVFKLPTDTSIDYIKRVIGLPGDKIQVKAGRLYINGDMIEREAIGMARDEDNPKGDTPTMEYMETLPNGAVHRIYEESDEGLLDDTKLYEVPEGHYFLMGDNRDNSQDSRVESLVGYVPFENIVGKADFIFFSTNGYAGLFEVWKWPWSIRFNRFFKTIEPAYVGGDKE